MIENKRTLTTAEAAAYVGLGASTLEKYRGLGCGPRFCRMGGKRVSYLKDDLDAWLLANRRRSTSEAAAA